MSNYRQNSQNNDIIRLGDTRYQVRSLSSNREYTVLFKKGRWTCNCRDFVARKIHCRHVVMIEQRISAREKFVEDNKIIIEPVKKHECSFCHSNNIKK